jgi:transcriptional regulator GlxA family with amidase domain
MIGTEGDLKQRIESESRFRVFSGGKTRGDRQMRRIPVYVVVPPRLLLLDVAGPLEVVRWANHVQEAVCFEVHYVGPSSSLQTSIGLTLAKIDPLPSEIPREALVLLAGDVEQVMKCGGQASPGR